MPSGIPLQSLATGVLFLDAPGSVAAFAAARTVFVYQRGTTTPVTVYQDQALTTPWPGGQPLTTDAVGNVPGYVASGQSVDLFDVASGDTAQAEPLSAAGTVQGAGGGGGTVALSGNVVNTQAMLQSTAGSADPAHAYDSFVPTPVVSGWSTAGTYADSTAGQINQLSAFAQNSGTRPTVAVTGFGVGPHAWGSNFAGLLNATTGAAIACELDFGISATSSTGKSVGLLSVSAEGGSLNGGAHIRLQASAQGSAQVAQGIHFHADPTTSPPNAQPVQAAGNLILADSAIIAAVGIQMAGAAFSTAAAWLPVNGSPALVLESDVAGSGTGPFLQIQSADGSTAKYGVLFHDGAGGQPVASAGTLMIADGGAYHAGLDLSAASFSSSAIIAPSINIGASSTIKVSGGNLGFFNAAVVAQQATTGTSTGFTANAGTAMNSLSTSTGGAGSTAYNFGDVILALKHYGLLAA